MINAKRTLLALLMGIFVFAGAFAQKGKGEDRRPPKNPDTKVVVKDKEREKPPPPRNDNQGKKNDGRRGRPD
jgi:hypothetical protein